MLDQFQDAYDAMAAPQPGEGVDLPASFGQSFEDAWNNAQLAVSSIKAENARNQAISDYVDQIQAAGGDVNAAYAKQLAEGTPVQDQMGSMAQPDLLDVANGVVAKMQAAASAAGKELPFQPLTGADIDNRAVQISQQAIGAHAAFAARVQGFAARAGEVLGDLAAGANDPMNIPAMLIPVEGLGVLGTAAAFGASGMATQAANEAVNAGYNEKIQPGYGDNGQAISNIAGAGIGGALFGGSVKAAGNILSRLMTGAWPTAMKDAANGLQSEANILGSNVLPGAEGEAVHQDALAQSIAQILRGDPVDPDIAAASQAVMARAQREQGFTLPKFDAAEVSRLSEEAALNERSAALTDQLAGLPAGDQGAAETLARLQEVERQLGEATTPEARRALSNRRDELLTDTNPETLQAAAAPIEQRRVALAEQSSIDARLQEIQDERAQAQLEQATSGETPQQPLSQRVPPYQAPTLFDVHLNRIDALMDMRDGAIAAGEGSPEAAFQTAGLARGVRALAQIGGSDMPDVEAQALARRVVASQTPDEARFILNQVTDRPRTLLSTLPSPEDFAEAAKADAADAPLPGSLTPDQLHERLASPETLNAMRADTERAIDDAAKGGNALQAPMGFRWATKSDGSLVMTGMFHNVPEYEPIFGNVADQLAEVDAMHELAARILACATPAAMAEAAQ